jgi:hypothetical protein
VLLLLSLLLVKCGQIDKQSVPIPVSVSVRQMGSQARRLTHAVTQANRYVGRQIGGRLKHAGTRMCILENVSGLREVSTDLFPVIAPSVDKFESTVVTSEVVPRISCWAHRSTVVREGWNELSVLPNAERGSMSKALAQVFSFGLLNTG